MDVSDDDDEEEQPDEGIVGLNNLFGTRAMPPFVDLKLLFTSQFLDKNFASLFTFDTIDELVTLALCCSKTMAVFRVLLLSSFFVVVETRLKLYARFCEAVAVFDDSYLGIIDSSEHVELPPELILLQLVLLIQFFVRIKWGDLNGERLFVDEIADLLLFSQGLRRVIRGVVAIVVAVDNTLLFVCGGTFINFTESNDEVVHLKAPVFDDEKFKTFVFDIFFHFFFFLCVNFTLPAINA